jgi:hypothetical protein
VPRGTSSIERLDGDGAVRTRTDSRIVTESWEASGSAGAAGRWARAAIGSAERAEMTTSERSRDAATEIYMA